MAPKPTQQQLAKDLFLQTEKTQQEIADILNVNRRTIYLWVKNGKWAEMKNAAAQTPFTMQNEIHNHFAAINRRIKAREGDNCPTMQEVEMLRKLLNMSATIDKFHTGAYIEAFTELTTYIYHKDVELARKVTIHADNYVKGHLGDDHDEYNRHIAENIARVEKNLENDPELEDQTLPPDPIPEPPPTDQVQSKAPQPIDSNPTPTASTLSDVVIPEENNAPSLIPETNSPYKGHVGNNIISSVPVSTSLNEGWVGYNTLSFGEGRGEVNEGHSEANEIKCDKNGITVAPANNSDNQLINNELNQPETVNPYPFTNFSSNGITTPQWQNRSFIDHPANEVLGKG